MKRDEGLRIVRGDLHRVLARGEQRGAARQMPRACISRAHGLAHSLRSSEICSTMVRRCDRSGPMVEARCARSAARSDAQQPPHAALLAHARPAERRAAASARRNTPAVLRPLTSTLKKLAEAPDQHPVLGEQQAPQADLLVRRAAPENRHRHQIDVELGSAAAAATSCTR